MSVFIFLASLSLITDTSTQAQTSWQSLGQHPQAKSQPSARGRTIHDLFAYQNRLYVGYGDYGDNTGPILHAPYNLQSNQWETQAYQDTEEVNNYQNINGILFSPSIDPAWRNNNGAVLELPSNASDYATLNGNLQWPDQDKFASFHVFDIRAFNSSSLIASGSSPDPDNPSGYGCGTSCATIWRSDNGGANWYRFFRDPTDSSNYYGGHRCYDLSTYSNKIWANCTTGHKYFNGSSWLADNSMQYAHKDSVIFKQYLIAPARNNLISYNNQERIVRTGYHYFVAHDTATDTLFVVDANRNIYSTQDLNSWSFRASLPNTATSFTAFNNVLYYGDAQSTIYRFILSTSTSSSIVGTSSTSSTSSTTAPVTTSTSSTTSTTQPKSNCSSWYISIFGLKRCT